MSELDDIARRLAATLAAATSIDEKRNVVTIPKSSILAALEEAYALGRKDARTETRDA